MLVTWSKMSARGNQCLTMSRPSWTVPASAMASPRAKQSVTMKSRASCIYCRRVTTSSWHPVQRCTHCWLTYRKLTKWSPIRDITYEVCVNPQTMWHSFFVSILGCFCFVFFFLLCVMELCGQRRSGEKKTVLIDRQTEWQNSKFTTHVKQKWLCLIINWILSVQRISHSAMN